MIRQSKYFYILNICIPLLIGGVVYYICCPDVYFAEQFDELTGINFHINIEKSVYGIRLLRFYFFDVLWAYSLTFAVVLVIGHEYRLSVLFGVIALFEAAMELLQLIPGVLGSFDIFDILLEAVTSVVVIFICIGRRKYEKS